MKSGGAGQWVVAWHLVPTDNDARKNWRQTTIVVILATLSATSRHGPGLLTALLGDMYKSRVKREYGSKDTGPVRVECWIALIPVGLRSASVKQHYK